MSEALMITALSELDLPNNLTLKMSEVVDRGMIDLRGLPDDKKFLSAAKKVLGFDLPRTPRSSTEQGELVCLWMSVDQWLITCPRKQTADLHARLVEALGDTHSLAVNVSDARSIIRLEGETVRETLMKGSSIDFTQPEFTAGTVRRMSFAEVAAMVRIVSEEPDVFELMVFRSYAHHAWDWICATAKEGSGVSFLGARESPATV
ncbi:MAG: sarcosine oxidase subunit gamma family protein [Pseudomonadota bacterium]